MANTTFSGPIRSEEGFKSITKNSSTGAITENITYGNNGLVATPVVLDDANTSLTAADNAGRVNIIPDVTGNRIYTLPSPSAGLYFKFIYGGVAADASNPIISTGADANFISRGGIVFHDIDGNAISSVFPNGSSNSKLTVNVPESIEINFLALDSTNWAIWGYVAADTIPAFADQ
jgi:hypothetical protein|tara:strand:+ start:297 stop:824 length:528 start_codon:yes stop_codon:yes gene_type:complete